MRLAAQVKGGYYAAHENAVAYAAKFLLAPQGGPFTILDPCAGEGRALRQLGELLNCPANQLFGIELDDSRADVLRTAIPTANILAPANFLGCRASSGSFPFIWLNPPFDEAYAGNRVENSRGKSRVFRVTVRLENGSTQNFDYADDPAVRVGTRVRVENRSEERRGGKECCR